MIHCFQDSLSGWDYNDILFKGSSLWTRLQWYNVLGQHLLTRLQSCYVSRKTSLNEIAMILCFQENVIERYCNDIVFPGLCWRDCSNTLSPWPPLWVRLKWYCDSRTASLDKIAMILWFQDHYLDKTAMILWFQNCLFGRDCNDTMFPASPICTKLQWYSIPRTTYLAVQD